MKEFYFSIFNYADWKKNTISAFDSQDVDEAIRICKVISCREAAPVRLFTIPEHGKHIKEIYQSHRPSKREGILKIN